MCLEEPGGIFRALSFFPIYFIPEGVTDNNKVRKCVMAYFELGYGRGRRRRTEGNDEPCFQAL